MSGTSSRTMSPEPSQSSPPPTDLQDTAYALVHCVYKQIIDIVDKSIKSRSAKDTAANDGARPTLQDLEMLSDALSHLHLVATITIGGQEDTDRVKTQGWEGKARDWAGMVRSHPFSASADHPVTRLSEALAAVVLQSIDRPDKPTWPSWQQVNVLKGAWGFREREVTDHDKVGKVIEGDRVATLKDPESHYAGTFVQKLASCVVDHLHARVDAVTQTSDKNADTTMPDAGPGADLAMTDADPKSVASAQSPDTLGLSLDVRLGALSQAGLLPDDLNMSEVVRLMDWIKSVGVSLNPA